MHNDHIGFQASVKKDVPKLQRIQCANRVEFNMSQMGLILARKARIGGSNRLVSTTHYSPE
ncbi:hypothetical protein [Acinetobacter sp. 197]|uniref:hypothetical protein n=1 Tax=Acinetobacter sp. 197 TaxID=3114696 RepID=UPI003A874504